MNSQDLLGKSIAEIHLKISEVPSGSFIPFEEIVVEIKLSSGQIVSFPPNPNAASIECTNLNPELKQVFPSMRLLNTMRKKSPFDKIEEKKIIGIWEIKDGFGVGICGLEFINGYFLVKGTNSVLGTGNADLFLFDSKKSLQKRFKGDLELVHGLLE